MNKRPFNDPLSSTCHVTCHEKCVFYRIKSLNYCELTKRFSHLPSYTEISTDLQHVHSVCTSPLFRNRAQKLEDHSKHPNVPRSILTGGNNFYRPQTKFRQGIVFTGICVSTGGWGVGWELGYHGIQLASGQYASYWNVLFLLILVYFGMAQVTFLFFYSFSFSCIFRQNS